MCKCTHYPHAGARARAHTHTHTHTQVAGLESRLAALKTERKQEKRQVAAEVRPTERLCAYMFLRVYICAYVCVCVCVRERERERESVCVCVCVYKFMYRHAYIYIHTNIHTYRKGRWGRVERDKESERWLPHMCA